MNYEKKYKESLERAKEQLNSAKAFDYDNEQIAHNIRTTVYNIFPELKESEGERIRKAIIEFFELQEDNTTYSLVPKKDILAWLEKQDFNYTFEIKEGHWYKCVCDYMLNNSDVMFKYDRLYYCRRDWRLTGEIDEQNVKDIGVNGYKSFFRPATNQEIKDWLEKTESQISLAPKSERKASNEEKIEPKFKIGDWVVTDLFNIVQIKAVENGKYVLENTMRFSVDYVDNCWHRWTIQDTKDGDVLRLGDVIAIFKKYIGQEKCICYCSFCDNCYCSSCNNVGFEIPIENGEDNVYGCTNTTPATKEERDLLFAKMKEAGYEWNANKKELIKL